MQLTPDFSVSRNTTFGKFSAVFILFCGFICVILLLLTYIINSQRYICSRSNKLENQVTYKNINRIFHQKKISRNIVSKCFLDVFHNLCAEKIIEKPSTSISSLTFLDSKLDKYILVFFVEKRIQFIMNAASSK